VLDSAGVYLIKKIEAQLAKANIELSFEGFSEQQKILVELVSKSYKKSQDKIVLDKPKFFEKVGRFAVNKFSELCLWMTFVGEFSIICLKILKRPWCIPWKSIVATVEFTGIRSMPIIAFLSFLIGVVLAYQIGVQLEAYGANIYIVNFLGIAIFREFGPLIAAIILAGRVSSAFTAHIGLMKANEELDALETMGLCPTELLIMPRIIGMLIAMPLLIVWCDIFGILGGMVMGKIALGVSFQTFLTQFPEVVTLPSFLIGLAKAPAFALIISSVGCFHGLRVSGSATSIGEHTTKSVVLAIFLIIIADALFSIILSYMGV
jgi:phospholipid/cholesterol/gamma-HCH transport system permease protein